MKSEHVLLLRSMLGFQLCWFALVLLQHQAVFPVLIYLAYGLWQLPNKARLAVLVTLVIGVVIDSLLLQLNVLQFGADSMLPLWFVMLWAVFSLAAVETMARWLTKPWLALLLGGIGGPLSYVGGAALSGDALTFPKQQLSVLVLVAVWAILALVLGQSRRFYAKAM